MKDKDIINLFDQISPETLAETDLGSSGNSKVLKNAGKAALDNARGTTPPPKRRFSLHPIRGLAVAAAALALIVIGVFTASAPQAALCLASPEYPEGISYYDNAGKWNKLQELDPVFLANLSEFACFSSSQVLAQGDQSQNSVYSPLSLYFALALAAEGAAGETKAEMIRVLNIQDVDLISSQTSKLFTNMFTDNEIGKLLLANSLWLQNDAEFNQDYLDKAAQDYFAHSFGVDFTDPETAKQISQWVYQNTGGKLGNEPQGFKPAANQVMSIINTVYFNDQWVTEFDSSLTKDGGFKLTDGGEVVVPFMNKTSMGNFAIGNGWVATSLGFKNDQQMLLILPDEGFSPYDILSDAGNLEQALTALNARSQLSKYGMVVLSVPKFNFTAELKLKDALNEMGMQQAFTEQADFTGITLSKPMYISDVQQKLSISIDEKGCEAAAYTKINFAGSAPPEDTIEMTLDRPFIFAITGGAGNAPLFIGVVNNPAN